MENVILLAESLLYFLCLFTISKNLYGVFGKMELVQKVPKM